MAQNADKKLTISMWVKRTQLGTEQWLVTSKYSGSYWGDIRFQTDDTLRFTDYRNSYIMNVSTTRKLRDCNGFYHILCSFDNSVGSPQSKIYINGELAALSTNTNYSQNATTSWNTDYQLHIGNDGSGTHFQGYMSDFYFIQGYEYGPTVFGETDATTGEWKPKPNASVNYSATGTNSCHLKFENAANPDLDSGDNNLSFSTTGSLISVKDNPSNVFATINELTAYHSSKAVLKYGNNEVQSSTSGSAKWYGASTLGFTKGKFYCEIQNMTTSNASLSVGVSMNPAKNQYENHAPGARNSDIATENYSGNIVINNANVSVGYGSTWTADGDVCMLAVDADNNKFYVGKNGTWANSDNPSTNTGGYDMSAVAGHAESMGFYFFAFGSTSSSYMNEFNVNFGNGFFGVTPITTNSGNGYAGADGASKFKYQVPTNFSALNTKGLNL